MMESYRPGQVFMQCMYAVHGIPTAFNDYLVALSVQRKLYTRCEDSSLPAPGGIEQFEQVLTS